MCTGIKRIVSISYSQKVCLSNSRSQLLVLRSIISSTSVIILLPLGVIGFLVWPLTNTGQTKYLCVNHYQLSISSHSSVPQGLDRYFSKCRNMLAVCFAWKMFPCGKYFALRPWAHRDSRFCSDLQPKQLTVNVKMTFFFVTQTATLLSIVVGLCVQRLIIRFI